MKREGEALPNWLALGPFIRDWVIVALIPVWLTLGISYVIRNQTGDNQPTLPIAAALFAYTLALSAAFLDDFSSTSSRLRRHVLIRQVSMNIKWIAVLVASAAIAILSLQDVLGEGQELALSASDTLLIAIILAATCFVLSVVVVLFGQDRAQSSGLTTKE